MVNRLLIDWSPFTKKRIEIERYIHRFITNFVNQERITIIFTIEMIEMVDFNIAHAQIIEINHFKSTQLYMDRVALVMNEIHGGCMGGG